MKVEVKGLMATRAIAEMTETSQGYNIADAKLLYKLKCNSHGMFDRAKACTVDMGYDQGQRVDYYETLGRRGKGNRIRL